MLLIRVIGITALLFALAATGYCAWNYVGPYAWLAEAQMAAMGSYEVQLTFLCTMLGFLLPVMVLVIPLRLAMGWQATQSAGNDEWIRNNRGSLMLGILGPMMLCVAVYFAFDALSMGTLTPMTALQIEQGPPSSRYVTITGVLVPEMSMSMEHDHITTSFVPLSSTGRPPYAVFVQTSGSTLPSLPITGVLYEGGLPGPVRDSLAAEGAIGGTHWTLSRGRSPDGRWTEALVFSVVGVVALGLLVLIRIWVFMQGRNARA